MEQQQGGAYSAAAGNGAQAPLQPLLSRYAAAAEGMAAPGGPAGGSKAGAEPQRHSAPAVVLRHQASQPHKPPQAQHQHPQRQQQQQNWALPVPKQQQPWQRQQSGCLLPWQQGPQGQASAWGGCSEVAHVPHQPQHRLSGHSLPQHQDMQQHSAHQQQGPQQPQVAGTLRALLHLPALRYSGGTDQQAGQPASQPSSAVAQGRAGSGLQGPLAASQGAPAGSTDVLRSLLYSPALRYSGCGANQDVVPNRGAQQQPPPPQQQQQGASSRQASQQHGTASVQGSLGGVAQQQQPAAGSSAALPSPAACYRQRVQQEQARGWTPAEQPQATSIAGSGWNTGQGRAWEAPNHGSLPALAWQSERQQQQQVQQAQAHVQQSLEFQQATSHEQLPLQPGMVHQGGWHPVEEHGPGLPQPQQQGGHQQRWSGSKVALSGTAQHAEKGADGPALHQQQPQPAGNAPGYAGAATGTAPLQYQQSPAAHQAPALQPQLLQQAPAPSGKQSLRLRLAEWGVPPGVVQVFEEKGVKRMYPWQAAALECGEDYSNLVYCAPTSGGKSLVAEVLMIRRLVKSMVMGGGKRRKPRYSRALVVLPYISIVTEKAEHLAKVLQPMRATVKGYFGTEESGSPLAPRGETVAVCTMEKANVAINKLVQEDRLGELCCVIVDELHMVADGTRGAGLELALSKLLFSKHAGAIQIVGMSATMGGLEALQAWLRARLFLTNYRPVPLTEHAVFQGTVFEKVSGRQRLSQCGVGPKEGREGKGEKEEEEEEKGPLEQLRELAPSGSRDKDRLVPLVAEVTAEGHSALVFCATRKNCEACAVLIAELLPQVAPKDPAAEAELVQQRQALLAEMREAMGGAITAELERCMLRGVAFHHAGLTAEERGGVERGYCSGCLQVLTATSTLAAGINLPARRVILRSLQQGIGPVLRSQYLQMVGRAGRAGQSAIGESFIMGRGPPGGKEWRAICQVLTAPMPVLQSQVLPESILKLADLGELQEEHTQCLQRLLLETVANGSVASAQDIQRLLRCTFAGHQHPWPLLHAAAVAALTSLSTKGKGKGLIEMHESTSLWGVTHKGQAVYDSGLPLELAMQLYDDLKRADEGVVLGSCLHLLYHCMLEHPGFQIVSWAQWQSTLERLPQEHRRVAEAVGVSCQYAQTMRMGRRADVQVAARHARFAAALAINDLMSECSVTEVVEKWGQREFVSTAGLSRGQMQKLQLDVSKWMGMAALLCETAGWWALAMLYTNMSQIAAAGVKQELLPLMKIPGMNAGRARVLFKAGFKDPQAVAVADPAALEKVLAGGMTQQMKGRQGGGAGAGKQAGGGSSAPAAMARRAAQALLQSAREYILQATSMLTTLAEELNDEGEEEEEGLGLGSTAQGQLAAVSDLHMLPGHHPPHALQQQQQRPGMTGTLASTPALLGLSEAEVADIRRAVQGIPATPGQEQQEYHVVSIAPELLKWTKGLAKVEQLTPSTPTEALQQFLAAWGRQPRFAVAMYTKEGEVRHPLQALAVCWKSCAVHYLELSRGHCAREVAARTTLLQRVAEVLGCPGSHKLVYDAGRQAQLLLQAGLPLAGPVEDPRAAACLLWPARLEEVTLKSLHASMPAKFQVRVPSLSKGGVTATCRTALLTLAVMDPLRKLLEAKGMLEVFTSLEMPAALAAAHVSAASCSLLPAPALAQAQAAAEEAIAHAEQQLQALQQAWFGSEQDLENPDTLLTLLGAMRLTQPSRGKGRPVVTVAHLQLLLQKCRPQEQDHAQVLHHLLNYKICQQALADPLSALQPPAGQQQQQPGQPGGPSASTAAAVSAVGGGPEQPQLLKLRLATLTPSGQPDWGQPHHSALGLLLGSHWVQLPAAVSSPSVQEELDCGSLSPTSLPGLPVAVWATRGQLAGGAGAGAGGEGFFSDLWGQQAPPEQRMLVAGSVVELSGKRLCTALDFSQAAPGGSSGSGQLTGGSQGDAGNIDRRRPGMALVRLPRLPAGRAGGGGRMGGDGEVVGVVELHYPCSEMWRIVGGAAVLLGGGSCDGTCASLAEPEQQLQQGSQHGGLQQQPHGVPLPHASIYPMHGLLSGQGFFCGAGALPGGSTLLCIQLQHLELLVLGALSGDPTLLAVSRGAGAGSPGAAVAEDSPPGSSSGAAPDPYAYLSNLWATAAGQVAAGASAGGQQLGVLLSGVTARAVVQALVHGWSSKQLGEDLGCPKPQATALLQSFLRAFPRLGEWWEAAGREGERRGFAATLAGRQQAFAVGAKANAMARGRAHKAMLQFAVGGSMADITKAAMVAVHLAASEAHAPAHPGGGGSDGEGRGGGPVQLPSCRLVLVLGSRLVVEVPEGSVHALAEAVRRRLRCVWVGAQPLEVAACLTAGRSLHPLCQNACT